MEQLAINFNSVPKPGQLFEFNTQLYKIYELLYRGGADAVEITKTSGSLTHSRRISDIRESLAPYNWTVMSKRLTGKRIYFYWLAEVESLPEGVK